jgi:SAM-dependent methyltransferase
MGEAMAEDLYAGLVGVSWDSFYERHFDYHAEAQELVRLLRENGRGLKVFEIGCGTGAFACELGELGCTCICVDRSDAMLAVARGRTGITGVQIQFCRPDELPPTHGLVDCFIGQRMTPSLSEFEAIVRLASAWLAPRGLLLLSYWQPEGHSSWLTKPVTHTLEIGRSTVARVSAWDAKATPHQWRFVVLQGEGGKPAMRLGRFDLHPVPSCQVHDVLTRYGFEIRPDIDASRVGAVVCGQLAKSFKCAS